MYVPYSDEKHWYNDIGFNEIELWIGPYKFHRYLTIFASSSEAKHTCYEMKKE